MMKKIFNIDTICIILFCVFGYILIKCSADPVSEDVLENTESLRVLDEDSVFGYNIQTIQTDSGVYRIYKKGDSIITIYK